MRDFIQKSRGDFKSEVNKDSLAVVIDCDDGPEQHSHPEFQRHAPSFGKYLSRLVEAAAVELQDHEYLIVFCGANSMNHAKIKTVPFALTVACCTVFVLHMFASTG